MRYVIYGALALLLVACGSPTLSQQDALTRWCITEMERLRDQVANLN